ncbi:MAG TPA: SRPBCC family protein [Gammaproteobacteria bacterium]|nr:SRPBCC family protein [Gammaproteobacteria bacterium]
MKWLLVAACMLVAASAQAAQLHDLQVSNEGTRFHVSADVSIAAPPPDVYKVLSDYNHLTRISGAIQTSRLLKQIDAHTALVYVETRVCVALFCRTLRQTREVTQLTSQDIVAQSLPEQSNVRMGSASWHLQAEGEGTRLHWQSTLEPAFWIPPLLGAALMKDALREQSRSSMRGIEKLAREWAHLPPLTTADRKDEAADTQH